MGVLLLFRMMSSILHCGKIFPRGSGNPFAVEYCSFYEKFLFCRVLNFLQVCGTHCSVLLEGQDCR